MLYCSCDETGVFLLSFRQKQNAGFHSGLSILGKNGLFFINIDRVEMQASYQRFRYMMRQGNE